MKYALIFILCFCLLATPVFAEESIAKFMRDLSAHHSIILGDNAPGEDSFAAIDLSLGVSKHARGIGRTSTLRLELPSVLESEVTPNTQGILLGHPCDNSIIQDNKFTCERWPLNQNEAVIKVKGANIIVAGTTPKDTQRAAKILANYPNYTLLKEHSTVIVLGDTFIVEKLRLEPLKPDSAFVCGDGICEIGEKYLCFSDCQATTCASLCTQKSFDVASCVKTPSNPNVPACPDDAEPQGIGYCAQDRTCCCATQELPEDKPATTAVETTQEVISLWERIKHFFKRLFSFTIH